MSSTQKQDGYAPFDLYPYNPEQAPAFAFLGLFGVVAVVHIIMMIPYRSVFSLPLILGCIMEAAGYYFRSRSHDNVRQTLPFIIQNLFILASPPLLAASIYMSPKRIAQSVDGLNLLLIPRAASKLFVLIDLACFITQVAGAIMSGSDDTSQAKTGKRVILAGLILQLVAFGIYITYVAIFHGRMQAAPVSLSRLRELRWQPTVFGLYIVGVLFIIRNITRIIEYNQGSSGTIQSKEVYLYVLDGVFMLAVPIIFAIFHPGKLVRQSRKIGKGDDLEMNSG